MAYMMQILTHVSRAEAITNEVSQVWHDSIFKDDYELNGQRIDTFNETIGIILYEKYESEGTLLELEQGLTVMQEFMRALKDYREELEHDYDLIVAVYKPF